MLIPHLTNAFDQHFMGGQQQQREDFEKIFFRNAIWMHLRGFSTLLVEHTFLMKCKEENQLISQLQHEVENLDVSRELKMWS